MEFCCKWHLLSLVFQEAEFPIRIPKGQHSSTKVQSMFYRDHTPSILNLQVPGNSYKAAAMVPTEEGRFENLYLFPHSREGGVCKFSVSLGFYSK